ncbi:unnamed protein product (macronuclear) [Paramecium tetraurelia]|uniref:Chromosome undetermined scaffold_103, whole genome shotgun sequence n=1 Tax=Paramecium tetraurelia TaxID=5888 RepID=Q3M0Z4_PARTE|nr:uncharacterized protein GSPATT00028268001 [Paramecium tetraurelia]CAH69628.1 syntaxin 4-2 [Paramecium tetraurelia]CAK57233.1 unnamed protein product [Paramecium tetraurelia]|eukprot:XP_001424631.1 hypothetical protein (macronuclear) [Paramecium tetraurelia strain d4-2]
MNQTLGLLKNKTHALNSFKENLRLKSNQIKGSKQSNPLKQNSLLLNSQNNSALSTDANISIEMQSSTFGLPAGWAQHYYGTIEYIRQIKEIIKELQILGTKRVKIQFGDTSQLEKSIYEKNQMATTKIVECEKKIQTIQMYTSNLESHSERRIRENISKALSQQISETAYLLRNQQKRMVNLIKSVSVDQNKSFLNSNDQKQIEFKQNSILTQQEEEVYEQIQQENDQEINKLVKMINDLAQVFQSLNQLVLEQGHLLDRIDENIDQSYKNIKKANHELQESERNQNSPLANKCIITLLGLIVVCSLILVIKYSS